MILPKLFGSEKSTKLLSWSAIAIGVGSMLGAPIATGLAEAIGSFNVPMIVGGLIFVVTILITMVVLSRKTAERIRAITSVIWNKLLKRNKRGIEGCPSRGGMGRKLEANFDIPYQSRYIRGKTWSFSNITHCQ